MHRLLALTLGLLCAQAADGLRVKLPMQPRPTLTRVTAVSLTSRLPAIAAGLFAGLPSSARADVFGLDFELVRDPVDAYFLLIAIVAIGYFVKQTAQRTIDEAADYDRRGMLANEMMAEAKRRDRAAARQALLESEPETLRRLQAERESRDKKRSGWKIFDADVDVPTGQ